MDQHANDTYSAACDIILGCGAVTSQWWLQLINESAQEILLWGGAVTILCRGVGAIRAWRLRVAAAKGQP